MFGLNIEYYKDEIGELAGEKNYHFPFRANEINFFEKHHKNHFRTTEGVADNQPYYVKYNYNHPTSSLNYLQNFNPTNPGIKYFKETQAHRTLYNKDQRPIFDKVDNRNTDIVDKIDFMRKPPQPHIPFNYSHKLEVWNK